MRFLIAIALLFSITPGMSEVVEAGVHLVAHADLPHHEGDAERGCSEHSCTPLAHHCGCHTTMSAQAGAQLTNATTPEGITQIDPATLATDLSRVSEPPPLRPPIA